MKIGQVTINGVLFNINVTYYDDTGAAIKGNCALKDAQLATVQALLAASVSHTSSGKDLRTYKEIKLNDTGTIYGSETTAHSADKVDANNKEMTIKEVWNETKQYLLGAYDKAEPVLPPSINPEVSLRGERRDSISSTQSSISYASAQADPAARRDSDSTNDTDDEEDEQESLLTPQQLLPDTEAQRIRTQLAADRLTDNVIDAALAYRTNEEDYYKDLTKACFDEAPTWEDVPRWLNIVKTVQKLDSKKLFDALKAHMLGINTANPPKKKESSFFGFLQTKKVYPSAKAEWVKMWNKHFRDYLINEDNL